jgi:hypothetical protein
MKHSEVTCEAVLPGLIEAINNETHWAFQALASLAVYGVAFANEHCEGQALKAREGNVRKAVIALLENPAFGKRSTGYKYSRSSFVNGFISAEPKLADMILKAANVGDAVSLVVSHWETDKAEDCFDAGSIMQHYGVSYGKAKDGDKAKGKNSPKGGKSETETAPKASEPKATLFEIACKSVEQSANDGTLTAGEAKMLAEYLAAFVEGGKNGAAEYKRLLAEATAKPKRQRQRKPRTQAKAKAA